MNTKQQNIEYHHRSAFEANENLDTLAAAGWGFARVILFSTRFNNEKQNQKILSYIRRFLAGANNPYDAYIEFCHRIMLFTQYIMRYKKGVPPACALTWFNPSYPEGFEKTRIMQERFLQKRELEPSWKKHWKALAEAVLDITEDGSTQNFEYWINWFRQRRAGIYLYLFLQAHTYNNFKNLFYENIS